MVIISTHTVCGRGRRVESLRIARDALEAEHAACGPRLAAALDDDRQRAECVEPKPQKRLFGCCVSAPRWQGLVSGTKEFATESDVRNDSRGAKH